MLLCENLAFDTWVWTWQGLIDPYITTDDRQSLLWLSTDLQCSCLIVNLKYIQFSLKKMIIILRIFYLRKHFQAFFLICVDFWFRSTSNFLCCNHIYICFKCMQRISICNVNSLCHIIEDQTLLNTWRIAVNSIVVIHSLGIINSTSNLCKCPLNMLILIISLLLYFWIVICIRLPLCM